MKSPVADEKFNIVTFKLALSSYLQNSSYYSMKFHFNQRENKRLHMRIYVCINTNKSVDVEASVLG